MSGVSAGITLYRRLLTRFPRNIGFCFAYGSGVKTQIGYENRRLEDNVLDFVLCVDDEKLVNWHRDNIAQNPDHYSSLKRYGAGFVTKYQRLIPANVYFNTLIPIPEENVTIKYGVVAKNDLVKDCLTWKYLYLAGRLQKPVQIVSESVPEDIKQVLRKNLVQALAVGLLLLPEKFSAYELFYKIAQLSYRGDFRMVFGENPKKVENIVKPQVAQFLDLYSGCIKTGIPVELQETAGGFFHQDKSSENVQSLLNLLPVNYQRQFSPDYQSKLANLLAFTVFKSSAIQSIKNIPPAGIIKAIKYMYSKGKKTFS